MFEAAVASTKGLATELDGVDGLLGEGSVAAGAAAPSPPPPPQADTPAQNRKSKQALGFAQTRRADLDDRLSHRSKGRASLPEARPKPLPE
jgi:hypothetical protein